MSKPLIYLASPYTHNDEAVREHRAQQAAKAAAALFNQGHHVFAPIPHGHAIAEHGLPVEIEFWEAYCKNMLDRCDLMLVLQIEGWTTSKGISIEASHMAKQGKVVMLYTMDEIEAGLFETAEAAA